MSTATADCGNTTAGEGRKALHPLGRADAKLHKLLCAASLEEVRGAIRKGFYAGQTAGLAAGFLQCNLVVLPSLYALDFMNYCQRNPKPCPLVGVSGIGETAIRGLGDDVNASTDVPSYNIYREGLFSEQRTDISSLWRDDFVAFALGCSFTFEHALAKAGVRLRHIEQNTTVPMYRTSIPTVPAGPFSGNLVVSMRPIGKKELAKVREISGKYPWAHGSPLHEGDPGKIGIRDVSRPDFGEPTEVRKDEIPVFWACGVTSQNAIMEARPAISIGHTPGCMLITQISENAGPDRFCLPNEEEKT